MERRTILRRIATTAAVGATGLTTSGAAAAESAGSYIDRPLDVSDVAGEVTLATLLTDEEVAGLPREVTQRSLVVDESLDVTTLDDCCEYCDDELSVCDTRCDCCELVSC